MRCPTSSRLDRTNRGTAGRAVPFARRKPGRCRGAPSKLTITLPIVGGGWRRRRVRRRQETAALRELRRAMTVGKNTVVAEAMEPIGERVEQEAPDELVDSEGHQLELAVVAIVAPAE